jgi:Tol biopolymer transport system component
MYSCWERGRRLETVAVCTLDWKTRKPTVLPGSQGLLRPAWSPDGRYVAALRLTGTQMVLYDMNSHQWVALADGANYGIPFWTRDSRSFYFQEVLGDASQPIFRVNVATRAVERMMSSREIPQSGFSGYTLTGLTPGGAPVATVLRSNGDLYALDVDLP